MRLNIISNLSNGAGLERDYNILKEFFEARGHDVEGVMWDSYRMPREADVNIFLEVITPAMLGRENWFVPNSEWYFAEVWDRHLDSFSKILCKTMDCLRIWSKKVGAAKCVYIGFESKDFYDPTIERKPTFLHMAGKSETKNTAAVMAAWRRYKIPYPLTVVAFKPNIVRHCSGIPNVTHISRVLEADLPRMMNENLFHVMPSKYEGFGHYIHEAIGCGGLVITTNGAPMNEFNGIPQELLIQSRTRERMRAAVTHIVSEGAVAAAVKRAAELPASVIAEYSARARAAFLSDREEFREALGRLA